MATKRIVATLLLVPTVAVVAQELRKPLPPIAPTDIKQCEVLDRAWQPVLKRLDEVHWDCFKKNVFKEFSRELFTPVVCLGLARQEVQARKQYEAQMEACRASVDAHKAREREEDRERAEQDRAAKAAEQQRQERAKQMQQEYERMQNTWAEAQRERVEATRRHVEEQQRAAAEAERQRREESQRAVSQAMRELTTARDRAEAYKEKAASTSDRRVDLTAGEMRALDDMRRRADAVGLRPRYVPAEPVASAATGAGLTSAVADLLGGEAESIIKWGLNRTETGERLIQSWEMADDFAGKYQAILSTYQYARSAWAGTTTYEDNVDAVVSGTGALANIAFSSTPAIAIQVTRVVSGIAGTQSAALYQIQMLTASDRSLSADEIAKLSDPRQPIQALFGASLPLDRIHGIERVWLEGNRFVDSGSFLSFFGR